MLTSITTLSIYIEKEMSYRNIISSLSSLKQLRELSLNINNEKFGNLANEAIHERPAYLKQLPSVKILSLNEFTESHYDYFGPFHLSWTFPNLEQINMDFVICGCDVCGHDDNVYQVITLEQRRICAAALAKPLDSLKIRKNLTFEWIDFDYDHTWTYDELMNN